MKRVQRCLDIETYLYQVDTYLSRAPLPRDQATTRDNGQAAFLVWRLKGYATPRYKVVD